MARREPRQTQDRILQAALAVFTERGYRDASIDDIAARAGVTKGAVYYWFRDKDDLAVDLHRRLWEQLAEHGAAAIDPAADVLTGLEQGFEAFLRALSTMGAARFFLRDAYGIAAIEGSARGVADHARAAIRDRLAEGVRRGEIRALDVDAMAHILIGAYQEATLHVLTTGDEGPTTEVVRHVVRSLASDKATRRREVARR